MIAGRLRLFLGEGSSGQHRMEMNTNFFHMFISSFGNKCLAVAVFGAASQSPIFNFYVAMTECIVGAGKPQTIKNTSETWKTSGRALVALSKADSDSLEVLSSI